MSSVSSLSSSSAAQYLRRVGQQGSRPTAEFQPTQAQREQFQSSFDAAAKELGIDSSKFAELGGKIQDALKNANPGATSDPQATVESTINNTLEANGIDPAKFKADFEKVLNKLGAPKPGQGGPGGPGGPSGFGGPGGAQGASYGQSTQQSAIQSLLDSLNDSKDKNNSDETNKRITSFLANAKSGEFLNVDA